MPQLHTADETRQAAPTWVTHTQTHTHTRPPIRLLAKQSALPRNWSRNWDWNWNQNKKKKYKPSEPQRIAPNRTEANRAPNHMRCIFRTCFGIFLNFPRGRGMGRGRAWEWVVGQLPVAAADSRHQAPVSSGSSGHDFRLTSFAANISFVRRAAGKSEQTRGQRTMPLGMCNSTHYPSSPPPFFFSISLADSIAWRL